MSDHYRSAAHNEAFKDFVAIGSDIAATAVLRGQLPTPTQATEYRRRKARLEQEIANSHHNVVELYPVDAS